MLPLVNIVGLKGDSAVGDPPQTVAAKQLASSVDVLFRSKVGKITAKEDSHLLKAPMNAFPGNSRLEPSDYEFHTLQKPVFPPPVQPLSLFDSTARHLELNELFGVPSIDTSQNHQDFQSPSLESLLFQSSVNTGPLLPFPEELLGVDSLDEPPNYLDNQTPLPITVLFESLVHIPKPLPPSYTDSPLQMRRSRSTQTSIPFHKTLGEFWNVIQPGKVQCKSCSISVVGVLSIMNTHLQKAHPDIKLPFICGFQSCQQRFSCQDFLLRHRCEYNTTKEKHCLFCSSFSIPRDRGTADLTEHTRTRHLFSGDRPYKCFQCENTFSAIKNLASHVMLHPEGDPSLATALKPLGLRNPTISKQWTWSLFDYYYNDRYGLPKETPGFDQKDIALIKKALAPK